MARALYFADGSHEVLFCDETDPPQNIEALERILRERLGNDAASLFDSILQDHKYEVENLEGELRSYECSCESYHTCLQDVQSGLKEASALLSDQRLSRTKLETVFRRLLLLIKNEL